MMLRCPDNVHFYFCLCCLSVSLCRLKPEALTDKELGQPEIDTEEEKEEGQDGVEEGLPASQPQVTTSQLLLKAEDLIIEEYSSD